MKQRNQAPIFSGESSYFEPPKEVSSTNQNSDKSITLDQATEDFKLRGKVEGRADKTLQQYDYVLGRFTENYSKEREVGSLETRELREHFAYLMDDGLKKTSVAINYRVLRAFFNWLERDGLISTSPVDGIREPKTPDKLPKVLNKDQIEKLLDTTRNWRRTWAGYRNFTMITLFLDTGLRLNECISAELDDLYNIKVIDSPAVNSEQILYLPTVQISGRIDCWTKKTAG